MTIAYTIDHDARLVRVALDGHVTPDGYTRHLEELAAAGGLGYGRVVDARAADFPLRPDDVAHFVRLLARLRGVHSVARTGFVVSSDALYGMLRMYQVRGEATDPGFAVFRSMDDALAWTAPGAELQHAG